MAGVTLGIGAQGEPALPPRHSSASASALSGSCALVDAGCSPGQSSTTIARAWAARGDWVRTPAVARLAGCRLGPAQLALGPLPCKAAALPVGAVPARPQPRCGQSRDALALCATCQMSRRRGPRLRCPSRVKRIGSLMRVARLSIAKPYPTVLGDRAGYRKSDTARPGTGWRMRGLGGPRLDRPAVAQPMSSGPGFRRSSSADALRSCRSPPRAGRTIESARLCDRGTSPPVRLLLVARSYQDSVAVAGVNRLQGALRIRNSGKVGAAAQALGKVAMGAIPPRAAGRSAFLATSNQGRGSRRQAGRRRGKPTTAGDRAARRQKDPAQPGRVTPGFFGDLGFKAVRAEPGRNAASWMINGGPRGRRSSRWQCGASPSPDSGA